MVHNRNPLTLGQVTHPIGSESLHFGWSRNLSAFKRARYSFVSGSAKNILMRMEAFMGDIFNIDSEPTFIMHSQSLTIQKSISHIPVAFSSSTKAAD